MNFTFEEYQKKLEIYRKNKQNVPLKELKTRYASGYNKLISDLKKMTEEILICVCTSGMLIIKQDLSEPGGSGHEVIDVLNSIIEKARQEGSMRKISRAVFMEFDIYKAMEIAAEKIWQPAWYNAYGPYWTEKCRTENGDIICDMLPGFTWDPDCSVWIQKKDGTVSFTAMLPPTMELIRKEEQECQMKSKLRSS